MALTFVDYAVVGRVATLTLNRPDAMNAMHKPLRDDLVAALGRAAADETVRVVVLRGAGRCFTAGPDLKEVTESPCLYDLIEEDYRRIYDAILRCPKPVMAAVHGASAGVGASITLACDLVLMAEGSYLFLAFANMGLIPDGGICWQLARTLGPKRAFQLIAEAAKIPAADCVAWGLANRLVAEERLFDEAQAWAESLAEAAPLPLKYAKQVLDQAMRADYLDTMRFESAIQQLLYKTEDSREAIRAFFEKRKPSFRGR
ncbi:MAG: enoyl-CoA hydratase [Porticoccaceae bacterium]|nr:MAG: enoyl-CoA hydratase [Porticoccaceae bacterium]